MLFNSYIFLFLFLPLSLLGYFLLHRLGWHKAALVELLLMSLWFYGYFNYSYLLILCGSVLFNWLMSQMLFRTNDNAKKALLVFGILANTLLIFYFKYYNFFIENINCAFKASFALHHILLPFGISFFTFQQIAYLVDSFRGETKDYNFLEYSTFVAFFPHLMAGPIVLHGEVIPQFRDKNKWKLDHQSFAHGVYIFAAGLFKKVLIADTFNMAATWGWSNLKTITSMEVIIVSLCYTFQIYFDFSGYSDMAIGLGKMFNIELPMNFNSPYKALSVTDFWGRWHLTLTRFLRKYIYFPLGGNRKGKLRTYLNIMIVFLVSGIWHGANWTFIIWGLIHGGASVLTRVFKKTWEKCHPAFQWICTFAFVNTAWIIFRSDNISQAFWMIKHALLMQNLSISSELMQCFALPELTALASFGAPFNYLPKTITGFYMWAALLLALFICLATQNLYEKHFQPTARKAVATVAMLVTSIVSITGVSTLIYLNF